MMNIKDMILNMVKNNNNPIFNNLVQLAENNDTEGLEKFARNYCNEMGKDFDKEFEEFKKQLQQIGINYKR